MPKTFTSQQEFPYPWQLSARAVWNKYPNPHAEHVVSVDVIDQSLDRETGKLRTERILGVRQGAPKWAVKVLGASEDTYVREVVMVDPFSQSVEMTSTNLSLSQYMLVKEYITYTPKFRLSSPSSTPSTATTATTTIGTNPNQNPSATHPTSPTTPTNLPHHTHIQHDDITIFNQVADISCTGLQGLLSSAARKVEDWSYSRFGDNAAKGRNGLLSVLENMYGSASTSSSTS